MKRSAWCLLVMVVAAGCVPLPVALPPARVGVAVMGAQKADPVDDFVLAGMAEVGFFPWQLVFERRTRSVDLGLGYRGTFGDVGPSQHGPFLEGAWFTHMGDDWWRLGTHVQLQALSQSGPLRIQGAGLNLRQTFEVFTFVADPIESCDGEGCLIGVAYGEYGAALFVEAGAGAMAGRGVWHVSAGLTLRLPAMVGIALVPIF